jgi:hypothetical protein
MIQAAQLGLVVRLLRRKKLNARRDLFIVPP